MADRTRAVTDNLHFNVSGAGHQLLCIQTIITKSGQSLTLTTRECVYQLICTAHNAHTSAPTTGNGLKQNTAVSVSGKKRLCLLYGNGLRQTGNNGHVTGLSQCPRFGLITKGVQCGNTGANKGHVSGFNRCGKIGVLAEKTVTRVHAITASVFGQLHNLRNV